MFQLTKDEWENLSLQLMDNVRKIRIPYAFTELGVVMLSSVLQSQTAILMSRNIIRTVKCNI
jgi:hypothetical protein